LILRIKNYWPSAFLIAVGIVLAATANVVKDIVQARDVIWPKKSDALLLADQTAKSDFSRQLTRIAWRRMFWARQFVARKNLDMPAADQDSAWSKYYEATADWNENLMVFYQALETYYPHSNKRSALEGDLQSRWSEIHRNLIVLRYPTLAQDKEKQRILGFDVDHSDSPRSAPAVAKMIDEFNPVMYFFVLNEKAP
jgi:hypothetical protein